jgi:hypothetical protein
MKPAEAKAAVAAELGKTPQQYRASRAPAGSVHDGLWYVSERDFAEMPIDDSTWIVFPDGHVTRGIPVGNPINPPTPLERLRPRQVSLDIVCTPNSYFGALFAERDTAAYYGKIARAVRDSTTWGQFRDALPADVWDEILSSRGNKAPDDDEPFPGGQFSLCNGDGWYVGGWPAEDEVSWFPDDLIEKYGGSAEYTGPNYDHLFFPKGVADDIAEELRARGHTVEKTLTGDLADWIAMSPEPTDELGVE